MHKAVINIALSCSIIFLFTNAVNAQLQKPSITIGGNLIYAKPTGDFKELYQFGGGAEVYGGVGLGKTFIIASTGFSAFKAQSGEQSGTLTYVPAKIGLRQFIFKKLLFVNADLGAAKVKNKIFNDSRFIRGFGAGVKLPGLQVALYYDGWKNKNAHGFSNTLQVKAGWSMSL